MTEEPELHDVPLQTPEKEVPTPLATAAAGAAPSSITNGTGTTGMSATEEAPSSVQPTTSPASAKQADAKMGDPTQDPPPESIASRVMHQDGGAVKQFAKLELILSEGEVSDRNIVDAVLNIVSFLIICETCSRITLIIHGNEFTHAWVGCWPTLYCSAFLTLM